MAIAVPSSSSRPLELLGLKHLSEVYHGFVDVIDALAAHDTSQINDTEARASLGILLVSAGCSVQAVNRLFIRLKGQVLPSSVQLVNGRYIQWAPQNGFDIRTLQKTEPVPEANVITLLVIPTQNLQELLNAARDVPTGS